jgi:hypothetical protein
MFGCWIVAFMAVLCSMDQREEEEAMVEATVPRARASYRDART